MGLTNGKRVGPGEFEADLDGRRITLTENARSVPRQLNATIGIFTELDAGDASMKGARLDDIRATIDALANGDLSNLRERLAGQAIAADAIFHRLVQLGGTVIAQPNGGERADLYLRNAAKMGDLGRKSLATLADIRTPKRSTFIHRQQNLVVAGDATSTPAQLGSAHGRNMDSEAATGGKSAGEAIEVLAEIDRASNGGG
jgi:hypothetical protein